MSNRPSRVERRRAKLDLRAKPSPITPSADPGIQFIPERSEYIEPTEMRASDGLPDLPEYTEAPGAAIPRFSMVSAHDSTTAPELGDKEVSVGKFATNTSELFDKYFLSLLPKQTALFLTPLIPIMWIFVQDNGAGLLQTFEGLRWWLVKSGIALSLFAIALVFMMIARFRRR